MTYGFMISSYGWSLKNTSQSDGHPVTGKVALGGYANIEAMLTLKQEHY
jgi:hypothetical protein